MKRLMILGLMLATLACSSKPKLEVGSCYKLTEEKKAGLYIKIGKLKESDAVLAIARVDMETTEFLSLEVIQVPLKALQSTPLKKVDCKTLK